jgi:hypothetical protein
MGSLNRNRGVGSALYNDNASSDISAEEGTMNAIKGIYRNGRIILDRPAAWPEETAVLVEPLNSADFHGATGDEQADDPESVARWIAAFDAIPPLEMTPTEEAEWQAARTAQKAFDLSQWEERTRRIERLFD